MQNGCIQNQHFLLFPSQVLAWSGSTDPAFAVSAYWISSEALRQVTELLLYDHIKGDYKRSVNAVGVRMRLTFEIYRQKWSAEVSSRWN